MLVLFLVATSFSAGCEGRYRKPRTLAAIGAAVAVAGSTVWVVGEQRESPGVLPAVGFTTAMVGVAAMLVAGSWIAAEVACRSDPDCDESEECREIPAPPGGVPYKQCMPR